MLEFGTEHPLMFIIPCLLFAGLSLYQFAIAFIDWRDKQPVMAALACLGGLAYLWPIGLTAKIAVFGPEFLRWHVADLGFVPMFGLIFARQAFSQKQAYPEEPGSLRYVRMVDKLAMTKRVMITAFIGITLYELLMGVIYLMQPGTEAYSVGSTDPIDLVMYAIGLALGLSLVNIMLKPVRLQLAFMQEAEAKAKAAHEAQLRAAKQARRKSSNRRRR